MGPNHFMKKTMSDRVILISFLAGPIHKLFKSGVHFAVRWILRFLGAIICWFGAKPCINYYPIQNSRQERIIENDALLFLY